MTRRELIRNEALPGIVRMALVYAVDSASMAVVGFLGGTVAARLGPRRTMLLASGCRAFVTHSFAAKPGCERPRIREAVPA